jgi:transposase
MKPLITDERWALVEPILPRERKPSKRGGRPRVSNRAVLTGILFVLRTGTPWQLLPVEMGCGSGSTCWRRFQQWPHRGVWRRLHHVLLAHLAWADEIDWRRLSLDSSSVPAKRGAPSSARIQQIKARRVANAILWSTPKASRLSSS